MDELIPASQEMPSASDAGGLQYIYSVLEEQAQLTGPFVQMIDQLIDYSRSTTDVYFDKLDDQTRIKILRQFEADFPEVFQVLFNFVYESYYINERIWQLIGYEPHPTMSMGATMEPFDEELLVQVRNRPPFFIDIKT